MEYIYFDRIKGSDRKCMIDELRMQYCGETLFGLPSSSYVDVLLMNLTIFYTKLSKKRSNWIDQFFLQILDDFKKLLFHNINPPLFRFLGYYLIYEASECTG